MEKSKGFKDLLVWQKAHQIVLDIYNLTRLFPKEELFVLTSQLRRSAISITANITERYRKKTNADKRRYFNIAQASLDETAYYLLLSNDLGYGNTKELQEKLDEIAKMLHAYINAIKD